MNTLGIYQLSYFPYLGFRHIVKKTENSHRCFSVPPTFFVCGGWSWSNLHKLELIWNQLLTIQSKWYGTKT